MPDATVGCGNHRDEIVRLEEQIDELADTIERCRKFSIAGRIVVLGLARDEYDRAVGDYQNCLLENTANLSACERQLVAMNAAATILFGRPTKRNTLVNE